MHADLESILAYWETLRTEDRIPHRDDLSPGDIAKFLPIIFLLERNAETHMVIRLMGTELAERMGRDMTDWEILDAMAEYSRDMFDGLYQAALNTPAGFLISISAEVKGGAPASMEFLHLPMRIGDQKTPELIFGALKTCHAQTWMIDLGGSFASAQDITIDWIDLGFGVPDKPGSA